VQASRECGLWERVEAWEAARQREDAGKAGGEARKSRGRIAVRYAPCTSALPNRFAM
jgi:hypothetical protein